MLITVQKHKYKLASAKNQLNKDYARLGKLYYGYLKKGNLDDVKISAIEKTIDIQLSNIMNIQKQLVLNYQAGHHGEVGKKQAVQHKKLIVVIQTLHV